MGQEIVRIEGVEIVIRVPISAIPHAASIAFEEAFGDGGQEPPFRVVDENVFAKELLHELLRESEDGTTLVDIMLDKACVNAAENGAEGLSE